jgi:hypothetical protein
MQKQMEIKDVFACLGIFLIILILILKMPVWLVIQVVPLALIQIPALPHLAISPIQSKT